MGRPVAVRDGAITQALLPSGTAGAAGSYAVTVQSLAGNQTVALDSSLPDAEALVFPMTRDPVALARAWARAARRSVELLREGRDLVFLVEGDASTFSTFGHLARVVRELAPGVEVLLCGHSHVPFFGQDRGLTVFNPGSIGPRRFTLPMQEIWELQWQLPRRQGGRPQPACY